MSDDATDLLLRLANKNGVACATVKDGHVLVFDRAWLKTLIDANDNEVLTIFVKRSDDHAS